MFSRPTMLRIENMLIQLIYRLIKNSFASLFSSFHLRKYFYSNLSKRIELRNEFYLSRWSYFYMICIELYTKKKIMILNCIEQKLLLMRSIVTCQNKISNIFSTEKRKPNLEMIKVGNHFKFQDQILHLLIFKT